MTADGYVVQLCCQLVQRSETSFMWFPTYFEILPVKPIVLEAESLFIYFILEKSNSEM